MLEYASHPAPSEVLLIHGAGGNNLLWKRTMQHLQGKSIARAVDLPGHPSGEVTCRSVPEYAESVRGFIEEAGLGRVSVCGHSMGSAIALTLAIDHPELVEGLVLVGSGAKLGVSPAILKGLQGQPLRAIEELITPMSYHSFDLRIGREARAVLSLSNLEVFLNDYAACNGFDVRKSLPQIAARTLIVCGESDQMTPPRYSHYLAANIPNSAAFFVREAGHMVPLEKPQVLGELVQAFLSGFSR